MDSISVRALTSTRIPTVDGEFRLHLYENDQDDKDHLALVYGDISDGADVLVRIHSECFTGDVLGSLRCDCGEQLDASMRKVAHSGSGIILYLRQEGRGIGLLSKLRAYELQDEGFDTVEANLMLGHGADERDYTIGARILEDMGVTSVRLLTNNPEKIESLEQQGIAVTERIPLPPHLNEHNTDYLHTKVERMHHLLDVRVPNGIRSNQHGVNLFALRERAVRHFQATSRPFVTLSYAQSIDGTIVDMPEAALSDSEDEPFSLTSQLRAIHDGLMIGIESVLAGDLGGDARNTRDSHPRPVVLDEHLRLSRNAPMLKTDGRTPLIVSGEDVSVDRVSQLEKDGGEVLSVAHNSSGRLNLNALLEKLGQRNIRSLLVEGEPQLITNLLESQLVDHLVITMAPALMGGTSAVQAVAGRGSSYYPRLKNMSYRWMDGNLVLRGDPFWTEEKGDDNNEN